MEFDFSGYATKNDLKCSDGRIIRKDAFKDNDGETVPLVWQHMHNDPTNVLGHALLKNVDDGVYAYCVFNDTDQGKNAKTLVEHGDVKCLSIYANQLMQKGSDVIHGMIREVSLVLAGANPGAMIDNLSISHSDGSVVDLDDEAIIYTGEEISFEDVVKHADDSSSSKEGETIGDIFNSMSEKQKNVVYAMISDILEGETVAQSAINDKGGIDKMKTNVFDKETKDVKDTKTLTHAQFAEIMEDAKKCGSLKESFLEHAQSYGIENIDILFPDAKTVTPTPDFIKRDTDWVSTVLNGARHTPFSRIKSTAADITADEARAKGYVKGNLKKEEVIKLLKRVTTPTTIYKKQKLDRDDIIDITDLDVVSWLKSEMRIMLDEELARAALVGDGRDAEDDDKINEENIRPIYSDDDMYAIHVGLDEETVTTGDKELEAIIRAMEDYEGNGTPVMYTTRGKVIDWLLLKDTTGRRLFTSESELASYIGVSRFIYVPVMKGMTRQTEEGETPSKVTTTYNLIGIIVNMNDYVFGADRGGQVSMFDDFDIDYNQYKYLLETRCSGALVHPHSALVVESYSEVTS